LSEVPREKQSEKRKMIAFWSVTLCSLVEVDRPPDRVMTILWLRQEAPLKCWSATTSLQAQHHRSLSYFCSPPWEPQNSLRKPGSQSVFELGPSQMQAIDVTAVKTLCV
jgi:hypothetical protein